MVKRLGIIARMDDSGLGHQTRDLVRALNPDCVLAIDFSFYNKFKQHREWYKDKNTRYVSGFIQEEDIRWLFDNCDVILTAETFYNNHFLDLAYREGKITLNQINYEFFEPLANRTLLIPTNILMPSYWHYEEMKKMSQPGRVEYLPPPTFIDDYNEVREHNYNRSGKKRFLHIAGKMAAHDRAGTRDLLDAIKWAKEDFELVIKVQSGDVLTTDDPRVTLDYSEVIDEKELYRDFDAMIHPRRYAGLNLPMNEALASGLPVIMTNIEPNNRILPPKWLLPSAAKYSFIARTTIQVYSANPVQFGEKLDELVRLSDDAMREYKKEAYSIAVSEFSPQAFLNRWALLTQKLGV